MAAASALTARDFDAAAARLGVSAPQLLRLRSGAQPEKPWLGRLRAFKYNAYLCLHAIG